MSFPLSKVKMHGETFIRENANKSFRGDKGVLRVVAGVCVIDSFPDLFYAKYYKGWRRGDMAAGKSAREIRVKLHLKLGEWVKLHIIW